MDIITRIIFWMDMRKSNNDIYYFIAKTILLYTNEIPTMGIEELANLCYTSPATISRFCRRLSFNSFIELKQAFQAYHDYRKDEVVFSQDDIEQISADPHSMIDKTYPTSIDALMETYKILDINTINKVTEILYNAGHIAIFGSIFSHLVARDCQYKFLRLEKFTTAFSDIDNQLEDAHDLVEGDAAIFFSVSGNSRSLKKIASIAKNKNIPIIVITNKITSPLAKMGDYIIQMGGSESKFTKSSMSGRIAAMSIVDLLYTSLAFYREQQQGE